MFLFTPPVTSLEKEFLKPEECCGYLGNSSSIYLYPIPVSSAGLGQPPHMKLALLPPLLFFVSLPSCVAFTGSICTGLLAVLKASLAPGSALEMRSYSPCPSQKWVISEAKTRCDFIVQACCSDGSLERMESGTGCQHVSRNRSTRTTTKGKTHGVLDPSGPWGCKQNCR